MTPPLTGGPNNAAARAARPRPERPGERSEQEREIQRSEQERETKGCNSKACLFACALRALIRGGLPIGGRRSATFGRGGRC